jgi:hypothetical protein
MSRLYLLKLWASTIVFAPLLLCLWSLVHYRFNIDDLTMFPLFVAFGFSFSLPTFLLCWLVFEILKTKEIAPLFTKLVLCIASIVGATATLLMIGGAMIPNLITLYVIAIIISSLLSRIKSIEKLA